MHCGNVFSNRYEIFKVTFIDVNLKIKSAQSFRYIYRDRMCVDRGEWSYVYEYLHLYYISKKNFKIYITGIRPSQKDTDEMVLPRIDHWLLPYKTDFRGSEWMLSANHLTRNALISAQAFDQECVNLIDISRLFSFPYSTVESGRVRRFPRSWFDPLLSPPLRWPCRRQGGREAESTGDYTTVALG
jgi:hypothetical protein